VHSGDSMSYTTPHEYHLSKRPLRCRVGVSPTFPAAPISAWETPVATPSAPSSTRSSIPCPQAVPGGTCPRPGERSGVLPVPRAQETVFAVGKTDADELALCSCVTVGDNTRRCNDVRDREGSNKSVRGMEHESRDTPHGESQGASRLRPSGPPASELLARCPRELLGAEAPRYMEASMRPQMTAPVLPAGGLPSGTPRTRDRLCRSTGPKATTHGFIARATPQQ